MSHVPYVNGSSPYVKESHVSHVNESCYTASPAANDEDTEMKRQAVAATAKEAEVTANA